MKIKIIFLVTIFILSIVTINCDRSISPLAPKRPIKEQSGKAGLSGNVGNNSTAVSNDTKSNGDSDEELQLQIRPNRWNVAWVDSGEEVIAKIRGEVFDLIDPASVKMIGPEGDIAIPYACEEEGYTFKAKFYQEVAISIIPFSKKGERPEIRVIGSYPSEEEGKTEYFQLTTTITIVGNRFAGGALSLEIRPKKWNVAWVDSSDEVNAKISGHGFDNIQFSSIEMVGPGGTAKPFAYEVEEFHFKAKFYQKDAIGIIPNPKRGDEYNIQVRGTYINEKGEPNVFLLTDKIIIVGQKTRGGELSLVIRPKKWNKAWVNSSGEVHAKISGEGFDTIDPSTVKMVGPEGAEISLYTHEVGGFHFMAKFYKKDAIGLILNPKRGDIHDIQVTGTYTSETGEIKSFQLTDSIIIVGKKSGEGDLSLEIKPDKWNVSWAESSEEVTARISGEGFDSIDFGSVVMAGPGGTANPFNYEIAGFKFVAKFYKSKAISIILDPKSGDRHNIQVTGNYTNENGETVSFQLTDEITIVGKKEK